MASEMGECVDGRINIRGLLWRWRVVMLETYYDERIGDNVIVCRTKRGVGHGERDRGWTLARFMLICTIILYLGLVSGRICAFTRQARTVCGF